MSSEEITNNLKVAVVCVRTSARQVRDIIAFHSPNWEKCGEIKVMEVPDQWRAVQPEIARRIENDVPKAAGFMQILVLDKLQFNVAFGVEEGDLRQVTRISALDGFSKRLPEILRGVGLDWLSSLERKLSKWHHGIIDKRSITCWLNQFEQCGSSRWIGEALLRSLEFWSAEDLISAVEFSSTTLEAFEHICVHRQQAGKSADVLASLFTKRIKPLMPKFSEMQDLYSLIESLDPKQERQLLYLEHGLFSGTEILTLLGDLLDLETPVGRRRKSAPLSNPDFLSAHKVTLLFPVATSFGISRVTQFLVEHNLPKIEVASTTAGRIDVLTTDGVQALESKDFFEKDIRNCPCDPDSHFRRFEHDNKAIWKNEDRRLRAVGFCKEIGIQLFRQYLLRIGYAWDETKIQRSAMGMFGMGLTFAFSHSCPKATIPLFWAGGKVIFEGKSVNRVPLFPNA